MEENSEPLVQVTYMESETSLLFGCLATFQGHLGPLGILSSSTEGIPVCAELYKSQRPVAEVF